MFDTFDGRRAICTFRAHGKFVELALRKGPIPVFKFEDLLYCILYF
jgi:hypothetical protein